MSIFTSTEIQRRPSNTFNRSFKNKLTCKAGYLIPILNIDAIPGDRINISNTIITRLMPMLAPVQHEMDITVTHHFVPLRLLWKGYEEFFSQPIPNDDTPVAPYFADISVDVGSLSDYLGLPTREFVGDNGVLMDQYETIDKVLAFHHAAYNKIYSDWYRDQNLIEEPETELVDGLNNFDDFNVLRKRAWAHDYFTAALPFAQKGEAVEIPIANFDDVTVYKQPSSTHPNDTTFHFDGRSDPSMSDISTWMSVKEANNDDIEGDYFANTSTLSDASAITINALRWANKLQEFLEKNARGGTRYIELVRSHFGVRSSDARLQRSEFLGWSRTPIVMSEVLSTANTSQPQVDEEEFSPIGVVGGMYGHGIGVGRTKHVNYFCEEHGVFMSILSLRPKPTYAQGIPRIFSKFRSVDWPWPDFAHLGEQEILNREIYYQDDNPSENDAAFGYMQRYAEHKYHNDRYSGQMRTTLNYWHMGRIFTSLPTLNQNFVECNPTNRIFNVTDPSSDQYIVYVDNKLIVRSMLPKQSIPSL